MSSVRVGLTLMKTTDPSEWMGVVGGTYPPATVNNPHPKPNPTNGGAGCQSNVHCFMNDLPYNGGHYTAECQPKLS